MLMSLVSYEGITDAINSSHFDKYTSRFVYSTKREDHVWYSQPERY